MPRIAMLRNVLGIAPCAAPGFYSCRGAGRTGQRAASAHQPAADPSKARGVDSCPRGPRSRRFAAGEADLEVQEGFYSPRYLEGNAILQYWQ